MQASIRCKPAPLRAHGTTCSPANAARRISPAHTIQQRGRGDAGLTLFPGLPSARQVSSHSRMKSRANAATAYDYDLVIVGCGVGGHGAALHAVQNGMKVAVVEGHDIGGTCVNRGCVPSKALLAASARVRALKEQSHLKSMGIKVGDVQFDTDKIAAHASNLASTIAGNLERSLVALGVDILLGSAKLLDAHTVDYRLPGRVDVGGTVTAANIIIATGSVPFVPPGIPIDGKTVYTSDHALRLDWKPNWVAIVGSGYIGLEFADVYTALGIEVTFVEAMPEIMPGFDREIAKLAKRILIDPRSVDFRTNVLATNVVPGERGVKPVKVDLVDFQTQEHVDTLEVDAVLVATGRAPFTQGLNLQAVDVKTDRRGFIPVDEHMRVLDTAGEPVEGVYCIGDANGKLMLAHAASAQGISAVETMLGRENVLNHRSVPAACFTNPEVSFVGLTEEQARKEADDLGFPVSVTKTSFKANSKALAEKEGDGMAKMIYRPDTGEILGVHILGLHAADLIHEASNAIAMGQTVNDIKFNVHAHPTVSEVLDEMFRSAQVQPA